MRRRVLETVPARILAPLLLAVATLLGVAATYLMEAPVVRELIVTQQRVRLIEILNSEQGRLETLAADTPLEVQRQVSNLGLRPGLTHALLVDRQGYVEAALLRKQIGLPLTDAIEHEPAAVQNSILELANHVAKGIATRVSRDGESILARVPVNSGRHLIVRVDFEPLLTARMALLRTDLLRETALMLAIAAGLAFLLNSLWFRRTARLTAAVRELGAGHLDARTGLTGQDELGQIGSAIDRMAADLETRQRGLERLSALIDHSPVVAIECLPEPGWPIVFAGGNVGQWGYDAQELVCRQTRAADLIHPDYLRELEENVARLDDERPDCVHELRFRDAHGEWRWISVRIWANRPRNGELPTLQGVLSDITSRKEAEAAARRQSDLLRLFYELPFIGMSVASLKTGRWLQINDRLCEILGYPREELMQKKFFDLTHPDDLAANLANVERIRRREIPGFRQEKRFIHKDGTIVQGCIEVRGVPGPDGEIDLLLSTIEDVTERKGNERALQQHRERLERAEAHAGLGSWELSFDTGETWWSPQMYALIGADPARERPGIETFLKYVHPDDRERLEKWAERLRLGETDAPEPFRSNPEYAPARWFHAGVGVECDEDGRPRRGYGTVLDITALWETEESLRALNATLENRIAERTAQLESANRELASFSYAVSHDLKAPLRGIDGYSQILLEDYGERLDGDGRRLLANIRRGAVHMHELIDDLLAYSHIERRPLETRQVDLPALVGATTEAFAREIAETGAVVTTDLRVPELSVDRQALALVLRNLVGNALKFSRGAAPPRVAIDAEADERRAVLRVRDNGIGFDMKYHARIFEIFQRLHRVEDYPGTGIGLALVRKAVERMGGSVRAESEPGRGATFIVEFPR